MTDGKAPPPGVGRLTGMIRRPGGVLLRIVLPDGARMQLWLPAELDRTAAIRRTAGLRRLRRLHIDLTARPPHCRLSALAHYPVERSLPLRAALAVAASGVPTVVRVART
ncbi:hypothetical protein ACVGVM_12800 [Pseudonocardia bannensis]|uniref:Uncharacterized protein n=1 Tax=Pseudonocardia bannensis TaxID=630973 RepID=A0A848DKZ4_9PSEU|nr:hypothetical protein [Pseudonocardia bannensis]NMH93084.1 hypothetical protein [Pseudonocardia bannensis]